MFRGSCVALVTPFKNGKLDEEKLRELVDYQIEHGTQALVPCGSTGESATLNYEEHNRVIEVVVQQSRHRIPVIAGTGSNSTAETIALTRHAQEVGADAALTIVPYCNKPTQQGMIHHFSAVARNVPLPLIIYNIPGRTGVNMLPSTLIQLTEKEKNIIGIKESSGNLDQVTEIACALNSKKNFCILSGDDSLTLPILSIGGHGTISVLANIAPEDIAELCRAHAERNFEKALQLHWKMYPLVKALFLEANPAPIKAAMEILGLCSSEVRLPLCGLEPSNRTKLTQALKEYGLLKEKK
ncbi:MAG: 4-hydroxy-tetrahydrodipicolinate synthase [Elusimicrobia bacterium]|nr:4-hydroxy-tetrahydrodipicolinate synthase [Elusimicrobiota bacterium]